MAKRSRKYQEALNLIDKTVRYPIDEGIELAKKSSIANFDATVELVFRLNVDPRKADQNLRGAIVLPHGSGKEMKVLVLTKSAKQKEAEEAGADYVGDLEYIEKIKEGWFDFDVIVATPDMMSEIGKIGRILGPKGLMPNAKTGTVTMEIGKAVSEIKAGKVTYRVDRHGNLATIVGKTSFESNKLADNIKEVFDTILRLRPHTVRGAFIKNLTLTTTMGPGIKIATDSLIK